MSGNSLDSSWGALQFPLASDGSGNLTGLDPARDVLMGLFAAALRDELTAVWSPVATEESGGDPVASVLPGLADLETMRQRGAKFPLLAVARSPEPEQEDEFTLWQNRITSKWTIDYILGPLEVGDHLRMGDILTAASRVVLATIRNGGHKAYATHVSSGTAFAKQVFGVGTGCCGFSTYQITGFIQGAASFAQGGPKYHALTLTFQSVELDGIADEAPAMLGTQAELGTGDSSGVISDLLDIDTSIPFQPG